MNSLIFDFPSQEEIQHAGSARKHNTVRFSPTSQMILVSYPTKKEVKDYWYNAEDRVHFKRAHAQDAICCSRMLFSNLGLGIGLSEDERIKCGGLEHLLSRDVKQNMLMLNKARKQHVRKVLTEQDQQRRFSGINSVEALGLVSEISSSRSRRKAHVIAAACMEH